MEDSLSTAPARFLYTPAYLGLLCKEFIPPSRPAPPRLLCRQHVNCTLMQSRHGADKQVKALTTTASCALPYFSFAKSTLGWNVANSFWTASHPKPVSDSHTRRKNPLFN